MNITKAVLYVATLIMALAYIVALIVGAPILYPLIIIISLIDSGSIDNAKWIIKETIYAPYYVISGKMVADL